jgi:hypothetical protein
MKRLRTTTACLMCLALWQAGPAAINRRLGTEDIQRATELARWPHTDAERQQFHARYVVTVNSPMVDGFSVERIEVMTPFRRLELIAEEHARINDLFARGGLHDAEEALRPWRDRVSILAHLRFDLTKAILGVPEVAIAVEGAARVFPFAVDSKEVYNGPWDRQVLVGAIVEATFDLQDVDQTTRPVIVISNGKEIARAPVSFGAIE